MFPSSIKIRAANGTIIDNSDGCDITSRMGTQTFTFPFLCSSQLSQQVIIGHNFCNTFNIGTIWTAADVMSLTYEGKPIAQCIRTKGIMLLYFVLKALLFHHIQMPKSHVKHLNLNHIQTLVVVLSLNLLIDTDQIMLIVTHEGLVTLDEHTASSGSFDIVMTNNSNRYVKVTKNQTLGMLQSCDSDQICTIHRIVTFEPKPLEGRGSNQNLWKRKLLILIIQRI